MDQLPNIDFTKGMGPALLALLAFIVPLAVRTYLKDREARKEKMAAFHLQACRMAYNSVVNAVKKGTAIEDKQEAGLLALDKFYLLRLGRPTTIDEKDSARLIFDAIHGEFCPGGAPPSAASTTP